MNYFDPARLRTMGDHPQLLRSIDAVPIMYVDPVSETEVELSAWVRTRDGSGHVCRSCAIEIAKLGAFMQAYINDPELVLTNHFDWTAHATPTRQRDPNTAQPSKTRSAANGPVTAIDIPENFL
jgi:hypothetical protein